MMLIHGMVMPVVNQRLAKACSFPGLDIRKYALSLGALRCSLVLVRSWKVRIIVPLVRTLLYYL